MKFSLAGVSRLKFPLTLDGVVYTKDRDTLRWFRRGMCTISFRSPNGLRVEMVIQESDHRGMPAIMLSVDGVVVPHGHSDMFVSRTDYIPDPRLVALVEKAICDLEAEEKRVDPTGRHAKHASYRAAIAYERDSLEFKKSEMREALDSL